MNLRVCAGYCRDLRDGGGRSSGRPLSMCSVQQARQEPLRQVQTGEQPFYTCFLYTQNPAFDDNRSD